jgi:uncharacterized protein (TIGR02453 family)
MARLTSEFVDFFRGLAAENNLAWFDSHRKVYESAVKRPFEALVGEMIERIAEHESEVASIAPRDAIFRINRDIRFAKDKAPYNTHVSANVSRYGKRDKAYPGFYFQVSHRGVEIYGGAYQPDPKVLERIRRSIARDPEELSRIVARRAFREAFGSLQGEVAKRLPKEWQEVQARQPLVANKQFYFRAALPATAVVDPRLAGRLMEHYLAGREVNAYLRQAFAAPAGAEAHV